MSNENLTEKTLADVKAGIPARDAEIETLRKENAWLREQLEAIGAGGVNGKLMPGDVSAEPGGVPKCPFHCGWDGLHKIAVQDAAYLAKVQWPEDEEGVSVPRATAMRCMDYLIQVCRAMLNTAPVSAQAQIEDDSIALDRLADYIADTWPMDKKYGLEEICQRLHAMWPGEFIPLEKLTHNDPNVQEALRALLLYWMRFQKSDGNQQDAYNILAKSAQFAWKFAQAEIERTPQAQPDWRLIQKGDQRIINGQVMTCTDPEIGRWQSSGPQQPVSGADLSKALRDLIRGYVNLLENGRDRILDLGGQCDPVDVMEASDPWLKSARAALAQQDAETGKSVLVGNQGVVIMTGFVGKSNKEPDQ